MSPSLTRPKLMRRQNLINGEWTDARNAGRYPVHNPASDAPNAWQVGSKRA